MCYTDGLYDTQALLSMQIPTEVAQFNDSLGLKLLQPYCPNNPGFKHAVIVCIMHEKAICRCGTFNAALSYLDFCFLYAQEPKFES